MYLRQHIGVTETGETKKSNAASIKTERFEELIQKNGIESIELGKNVQIPEDLKEEADYWRSQLIEAVAEYDDKLMEKFFDDPASISEDEIHEAIRKATIDMTISRLNTFEHCST